MADDLKEILKKLLVSKGEKKFFFAYGTGKRKDGKGEGELVVRGKKPKKTEIEEELADGKEVFEGVCWTGNGPENGETVYFQAKGKKLSTPLITKMLKTAKTTTGRQYDFQLPTPEEEARADKLKEGGGDENPAETASQAVVSPTLTVPAQSGSEVIKRLNAMSADIKTALAGPNKARVQTLFVTVNGLINNRDYIQAGPVLDELAALLAKPATASPDGSEVIKRLNAMSADIKTALAGPNKARVQTLFGTINGLIKNSDYVQAGTVLDELALLVKQATVAPVSNVAFQQSLLVWDAARKKTHADLQELEREILELFNDDPRLEEVKQNARKLDVVLGDYAEELRDRLDDAANAPAEEKADLRAEALAVLKRYRAYLSTDPFIKAVANNKLKPIDIEGVLGKTLDAVANKLGV